MTISPGRGRLILAVTVLGSSLTFIDGTVVNVALPAVRQALDARPDQVQWIGNAYLLLLGSLVLIGGSAGDRYGRRKAFVVGVAGDQQRRRSHRRPPGRGGAGPDLFRARRRGLSAGDGDQRRSGDRGRPGRRGHGRLAPQSEA